MRPFSLDNRFIDGPILTAEPEVSQMAVWGARVQKWWELPASQPRHTGEIRYPSILATLDLGPSSALPDSGLRRCDEFRAFVNFNPELLMQGSPSIGRSAGSRARKPGYNECNQESKRGI